MAVVIAYRRPDLLREVLDRLDAQSEPPLATVVVDNGGDLTADDLREVGGKAPHLISRPDNPGYAAAVNLAAIRARQVGARALFVLTHDAVFDTTLGSSLLSALAVDLGVGAAAPTLYWVSKPERVFSAGGVLTTGGRAYHRLDSVQGDPRTVAWADGAAVMYRMTALEDIGGIDERYFLYFEDVDTGWELARKGWRTVVTEDVARQEPGAHPVRLGLRNMVLFAQKAELPRGRAMAAVIRRAGEEIVVAALRDRRIAIADAWHGLRDGFAGKTGAP
ncbi:glycosyltransferase [Microbacterium sp. 22242]|uniref:glycosyltransferase n=1 Tax=Microbacterium sp. 22242 TaxID=3453896 RepID=UPI003F83D59B